MNLQSIRNALPDNYPITGICVVADPTKNPVGYEVLYKSTDKNDDCDLWKDGLFRTKVTRYLCITRQHTQNSGTMLSVLDDIVINNEKDPAPNGFSIMLETVDSHEKASRKKQICIKMAVRNQKKDAISDIIILSRAKRPPPGYTLVGEINGLQLCFKRDVIPKDASPESVANDTPTPAVPAANRANGPTQALPYQLNRANPGAAQNAPTQNTLLKQVTVLMPNKPLADVPFQLDSRFQEMENLTKLNIPELHYRSLVDIENEYGYDFRIERTAAARLPPDV